MRGYDIMSLVLCAKRQIATKCPSHRYEATKLRPKTRDARMICPSSSARSDRIAPKIARLTGPLSPMRSDRIATQIRNACEDNVSLVTCTKRPNCDRNCEAKMSLVICAKQPYCDQQFAFIPIICATRPKLYGNRSHATRHDLFR